MSGKILKPNFPPANPPDTHYKFLASVGITRERLKKICVRSVDVVGISSIEDNTVKIEYNSSVYENIPVWIHTDYGTRRRYIRNEEAVNPEDYFERAALIFPLPGAKALALVESNSVLGLVSVLSNSNLTSWYFYGVGREEKPLSPRVGGWPTWKQYIDIKIYSNDYIFNSKNEVPTKERAFHRIIYDLHEDSIAQILNATKTGLVPAEYSFTDADSPTAAEQAQEDVAEAFLARGTVQYGEQIKTVYVKKTNDWYKSDPMVSPGWDIPWFTEEWGNYVDLNGIEYNYGWVGGPGSWTLDELIPVPFSPGAVERWMDGPYDQTINRTVSMAGFAGYEDKRWSEFDEAGRGYPWCIMATDGTFESPSIWMTVPYSYPAPVTYLHPDAKEPVAFQPNTFSERRMYDLKNGDRYIFDFRDTDIYYTKQRVPYLGDSGTPTGIWTYDHTVTGNWKFTVTKNDGMLGGIHSFVFPFSKHTFYDEGSTDRGEHNELSASMTPLYARKTIPTNYIFNTLFFSHGIGIANLKNDMGIDETEEQASVVSKDVDTFMLIVDDDPDNSSIQAPSIDISSIVSNFRTAILGNSNEGYYYRDPDVGEHDQRTGLMYFAGHVHVTCDSYLVPYDLDEALI
jgi:hypothetical protein